MPVDEEVLDSLTFNTLKQHFTADAWMAVVQRGTVAWLHVQQFQKLIVNNIKL